MHPHNILEGIISAKKASSYDRITGCTHNILKGIISAKEKSFKL
jgi:hypothetical protein